MEWYMPIMILPGISILLVSTANLVIGLNEEINLLPNDPKQVSGRIIKLKLAQLKKLSLAMVSLYAGIFFFLLTGLLAMMGGTLLLINILLGLAMMATSMAIALLVYYAVKAVSIRQHQFKGRYHVQLTDNS